MKPIRITLLALLGLTASALQAQDDGSPLPFSVSVGGKAAVHTKGEPFAKIADSVAADAAIEVGTKAPMTIINVHKAKADGSPDDAAQPAIILLQGTNKGALNATMDKQTFAPGKYFLSVVADSKTASIQFSIK